MAKVTDPTLDLVSSLYGPGTVLGWQLAGISCLLKWIFSSEDLAQGADGEFIAFIAYGFLAVGDLISQIRHLDLSRIQDPHNLALPEKQHFAKLDATLVVSSLCMVETPVLYMLALALREFEESDAKRLVAMGLLGVSHYAAGMYLFYDRFITWGCVFEDCEYRASKFITVTCFNIHFFLLYLVIGLSCVYYATELILGVLPRRTPRDTRRGTLKKFATVGGCVAAAFLTFMFCALAIVSLVTDGKALFSVLPKSNFSLGDFDQALALFIGAVVVVMNGFYIWKENLLESKLSKV